MHIAETLGYISINVLSTPFLGDLSPFPLG